MDSYTIDFKVPIDELFNQEYILNANKNGSNFIRVSKDSNEINKIKNIFRYYSGILHNSNKSYIGEYIKQSESLLKVLEGELD